MRTFLNCPYSYRLRYHEGIQPPEKSPYAEFGSYLHKVFEEIVNGSEPESALKSYLSGFEFPSSFLKDIPVFIKNFLRFQNHIAEAKISETELKFELPVEGSPVPLLGVIDLLLGDDNGVMVVDYKTGKREKSRRLAESDEQMLMYAYAASQLAGVEYRNIRTSLFYVRSGRAVVVEPKPERVERFIGDCARTALLIKEMPASKARANPGSACSYCDFKGVCPARKRWLAIR